MLTAIADEEYAILSPDACEKLMKVFRAGE